MGDVITVDQITMKTMTMLKESIAWDKSRNNGGKYDRSIDLQKRSYRSLMDEVLGREAV